MNQSPDILIRPLGGCVRIPIVPRASQTDDSVGLAWEELHRANPVLHDGPILLALADELRRGELVCRAGGYRELATASMLGRADRTRALGVCGLVVGRDSRGDRHVLFGRRGVQTRIYGGMWENAPSGTVAPPRAGAESVAMAELVASLRDEGIEELGIDLAAADVTAVAMLEDARACSVDVVLSAELPGAIDARASMCVASARRWEYVDTAWVAERDIEAWIERDSAAISPPTLGLVRWWMGGRGRSR